MLTGESGGTADDSLSQLICLAFSLALNGHAAGAWRSV